MLLNNNDFDRALFENKTGKTVSQFSTEFGLHRNAYRYFNGSPLPKGYIDFFERAGFDILIKFIPRGK